MGVLQFMELDDNKKPLHSFDTFAVDVSEFRSYGFIIGPDLIMVDFDEKTEAADFIAREFPTLKIYTDRGFHLYYRKPKGVKIGSHTKNVTALGIHADFKTGNKAQGVLKLRGVERKRENSELLINNDTDAFPELPPLLYPTRAEKPLNGLKEGEGRNDALYKHLCYVLSLYPKYNKDGNLFKLATMINNFVFAESMPDREKNSVVESVLTRDFAKSQLYIDEKDVNMTAKYFTERLNIHSYQRRIYFFNEELQAFDCDRENLEDAIYKIAEFTTEKMDKIVAQFRLTAKRMDSTNVYPLQLGGGYILDDGEPIEVSGIFTPYFTRTRYNPNAYCERTDKFLNYLTCDDKKLRMMVEEILGHALLTHSFPHKAFFFVGEKGGNGKSTFLEMVRGMLGDSLISNVSIERIDTDDTSTATMQGKLANLADDENDVLFEKSGNFKSLVSGDRVLLRPIYKQPIILENIASLIVTCNKVPRFKDRTGGLARRIIVVPCDNTLPENQFDMTLKRHLLTDDTSRSYVLNLAIAGIKRIRENGNTFTRVPRSEEATKEYLMDNDLVGRYLGEMGEHLEIEGKPTKECYNQFIEWCIELGENGYKVNQNAFGRAIKKYTGLISTPVRSPIDKTKLIRIYEKPKDQKAKIPQT